MIDALVRRRPSGDYRPSLLAKRRDRAAKAAEGLPWGLAVPIILALTMAVFASLWLGWKIDQNLGELSRQRRELSKETEVNRDLVAQNARLLTKKNITMKAAVLGLFPPNEKQIRKP